jgi:DNA-binding transcriptional LysR family regulator
MNLQWLYYFDTIAELEHYTKAAEKLHVSQSNLSHAIKELEAELGAELFERHGRNVKLTKYGEIFQPYVKKTLNTLETGVSTLKEYIDPNAGTIVMGGFPSVAQFSTDLMVRYQSETNRLEVQFQYTQEGWRELKDNLLNGNIDVAIATRFNYPQIGATYIGTHRLVALLPEQHRLANRQSVDLREMDRENYIAFDKNGQIRPFLDGVFKELGIKLNIVAETPNDLIIFGLVAAGRGIAILPDPLAGAPFGTKIVPISNDIPQRKLYLQWNKDRYISPATAYFRDYVKRSEDVFDQYLKQHKII